MKLRSLTFFLFFILGSVSDAHLRAGANIRETFYSAFSSGNLDAIEQAIQTVKVEGGSLGRAFEGALLMKKADLVKGVGEKLKTFKAGHELFEKEVAAQPQNAELRFVRLCVQENASKIVKYRDQLDGDKAFVVEHFESLSADTKKYVRDYAKSSKVLSISELK